jgi:hypothetical protein
VPDTGRRGPGIEAETGAGAVGNAAPDAVALRLRHLPLICARLAWAVEASWPRESPKSGDDLSPSRWKIWDSQLTP